MVKNRIIHLVFLPAILALSALGLRGSFQHPAHRPTPSLQLASVSDSDELLNDNGALAQLALLNFDDPVSLGASAGPAKPTADFKPRRRPVDLNDPAERSEARMIRPNRGKLTPEMIDRCLEVARDIDPAMGRQLARRRETHPQDFESALRQQHAWRLLAMAQLKQRDPELYATRLGEFSQSLQVNRVAVNLRVAMAANDETLVESLKDQLRAMLQMQLAMSIKARGDYLCRLEEKMQKVRDEIDREAENFQATIEGRMQHYMHHFPAPSADPDAVELIPVSN